MRQMIGAGGVAAGGGSAAVEEVHVITLHQGEHQDSTLYRFEKGSCLQFSPGPSLLGRKVLLYTNYPVADSPEETNEETEFVRNQYYSLPWREEGAEGSEEAVTSGALLVSCDAYCRLRLTRPGVYHAYTRPDTSESRLGPQSSCWFHVLPSLVAGGEPLPLDAVCLQTVLSKCLGPLTRWEQALRPARDARYNVLHFTPVQELGGSNSSYSIANQLRLNPAFGSEGRDASVADLENLLTKLRHEWKMLSICDIVLNHTANETEWLEAHPEAAYSPHNCPHLRGAALLDAALALLSADVAAGRHAGAGLPPRLDQHHHLNVLRHILETEVVPPLRLHELFQCRADELLQQFLARATNKVPPVQSTGSAVGGGPGGELRLIPDPQYRRLRASVDMELALQLYNVYRAECYDEESRLKKCGESFRAALTDLNAAAEAAVRQHERSAIDNVLAGVRYERLQADGPRIEEVSAKHPLVPRYFLFKFPLTSVASAEAAIWGEAGALVMAHNGWVMDADPLQDFAADPACHVYLRRELIAWGDSVKLRYGAGPEHSAFLWAHMRDYVELTAELFDGVRLDNCHSTPLHVAEYMLDCARNVKPELLVVGELFTNSDLVDNVFVNRLGITSLIREALGAGDAHEQGRLVHRFGGRGVGALLPGGSPGGLQPARPAVAHALLCDLTHDNPSPMQKRCVFDMLPSAALVAASKSAAGSTRGYDDLVPHHIDVVEESRLYSTGEAPLLAVRRALNELHVALAAYPEVYVDQMDGDVVAVTRHQPASRRSVVLVAHTAFRAPDEAAWRRPVPPLRVEGEVLEVLLEADITHKSDRPWETSHSHRRDPHVINGLTEYSVSLRQHVPVARSAFVTREYQDGPHTVLELAQFPPGSVLAVAVALRAEARAAVTHVQRGLASGEPVPGLSAAYRELSVAELALVLYQCGAEEGEAGGAVYNVPGHGDLVYGGLQGVAALLADVRASDDLGHALCDNIRRGDWLLEYTAARLRARLPRLADLYVQAFRALQPLPRYLQPAYVEAVLSAMYRLAANAALHKMAPAARADSFSRALALTAVQLLADVPSSRLPAGGWAPSPTLSAGLPHFATGYMRTWGRDTFIALPGLMLATGLYPEARAHLLGFGAALRHGLLPNLLASGQPRYNCRDALWWWLRALKLYCESAPQGYGVLTEPVARLFPTDEAGAGAGGSVEQPLHDIVQEALHVHFQGLVFRERGAGRGIDAHMTDLGFSVQVGVDPETGFVFGGNAHNAGTWMDKMGSSERAGNRGKPATPRDGSAVELVGLAYCAVAWLADAHRRQRYPYPGVTRRHADGSATTWTWQQWADRIRRNFERFFWVSPAPSATDLRPDLVHRRAVYKDSHGASQPWADYQLRCNFPIAMAVAPDLFDSKHAWQALDNYEKILLGPLGVKTLDPADWAYRPDYDNSNDSEDHAVAHGFNYHQGPEWVWPIGFYLQARLQFAADNGCLQRTIASVYSTLAPHVTEIRTTPWRGLPELTQAGGGYCRDSCRTQAWSSGCVFEALVAARAARRARVLPAA